VFVSFRKAAICAGVLAATICIVYSASAQSEEEMNILRMIYREKDLVVTPTRSAKPMSQVAENVTVVTAAEIEAINAHTLTDVLYHVTGVQMDISGGPGSRTSASIQGSNPRHVQVMVDGVSLNNLSDNSPDIGAFPVQQIERIEIVKGPASSAWGSSLGGIINIITKSADPERKIGGTVSASGGESGTGDFRADLSGTAGSLGYFLYGGGLTTDGLTPNTPFDSGNFYGKLQLQATKQFQVLYTLGYSKGRRGNGEAPAFDLSFRQKFEYFFSTVALNYAITEQLDLSLAGRLAKQHNRFVNTQISNRLEQENSSDDASIGGNAKLNWRSDWQNLLIGADYDNGELESNAIKDGKQDQVKWAVFANDTVTLGDFAVTPGLRYDHISTNGDFVSPSLGITYTPLEQTILRGYVARGFNIPPLGATFGDGFFSLENPALQVEKVWSYSVGVETAVLTYFRFKTTGFIHDIRDVIVNEPVTEATFRAVNKGRQRRQGAEVEIRTVPIYNTSLLAGYTLLDVRDRETDQRIRNFPTHTYDLGLDYNGDESLRGALRGHYIWWNADPAMNGRYSAIIWDMNLNRKIIERSGTTAEAFFTAHNIFNGAQYLDGFFPNPRRWFEVGLKFRF
jgi:vitamin B12 transporter